MSVPFALRRPWLLVRGARADRDRPDLDYLAAIDDPMGFVWAVLPHVARTFATSILMLPAAQARTAAVAYLYCRMLDTYEDLGDADREAALEVFAARMKTLEPPPPVPTTTARDDRDRVHLLLVERCSLVDRVYATLPGADRQGVADLVQAMANGMAWSLRRFAEQGGVLINAEQLSRYCHYVIGEPILFTLQLVGKADLTTEQRQDALATSELIQLANITRDVERDLVRGIGYHPSLFPHLGSTDAAGPVREARRHLMAHALPHAPAYTRLAEQIAPSAVQPGPRLSSPHAPPHEPPLPVVRPPDWPPRLARARPGRHDRSRLAVRRVLAPLVPPGDATSRAGLSLGGAVHLDERDSREASPTQTAGLLPHPGRRLHTVQATGGLGYPQAAASNLNGTTST